MIYLQITFVILIDRHNFDILKGVSCTKASATLILHNIYLSLLRNTTATLSSMIPRSIVTVWLASFSWDIFLLALDNITHCNNDRLLPHYANIITAIGTDLSACNIAIIWALNSTLPLTSYFCITSEHILLLPITTLLEHDKMSLLDI